MIRCTQCGVDIPQLQNYTQPWGYALGNRMRFCTYGCMRTKQEAIKRKTQETYARKAAEKAQKKLQKKMQKLEAKIMQDNVEQAAVEQKEPQEKTYSMQLELRMALDKLTVECEVLRRKNKALVNIVHDMCAFVE